MELKYDTKLTLTNVMVNGSNEHIKRILCTLTTVLGFERTILLSSWLSTPSSVVWHPYWMHSGVHLWACIAICNDHLGQ